MAEVKVFQGGSVKTTEVDASVFGSRVLGRTLKDAVVMYEANARAGTAMGKSLDLDTQAVSNVTWNDAVEFCNWLSLREGLPAAYERRDNRWQLVQPANNGYRLPTEAEWEYAARYLDGKRWQRHPWGDVLPPPAGG